MQFRTKAFQKTTALLLAITLAIIFIQVSHASATTEFDQNDVEIIRSFLMKDDGYGTNADILGWDVNNPQTWAGIKWEPGEVEKSTLHVFEIDICDSGVTSIELSGLDGLKYITLLNNALTYAKLSDLPRLDSFRCSYNQLTNLSLSNLPELKWLNCSDNLLPELNIAGLSSLISLECASNQMISLHLSNLPQLRYLYCFDNLLTMVDIVDCDKLGFIYAHENPLDAVWAAERKNNIYIEGTTFFTEGVFTYTEDGMNYSVTEYICRITNSVKTLTVASKNGYVPGSNSVYHSNLLIYPLPGEGFCFAGWSNADGLEVYEMSMDGIRNIYIVVPKADAMSITAILCPVESEHEDFANPPSDVGADESVPRADFLMTLVDAFGTGCDTVDYSRSFSDIPFSSYCDYAATRARELGIIIGTGGNNFSPGALITRQDMITMTYRALKVLGKLNVDVELPAVNYSDWDTVAVYAREPVRYLSEFVLANGNGDNINPTGSVRRAESTQFLNAIMEYYQIGQVNAYLIY